MTSEPFLDEEPATLPKNEIPFRHGPDVHVANELDYSDDPLDEDSLLAEISELVSCHARDAVRDTIPAPPPSLSPSSYPPPRALSPIQGIEAMLVGKMLDAGEDE